MGWLQRLDHFQRPQSDFSEPTLGGVIVTLLLGAAVIGATAYEFVNWSVPELSSTMVVKSHWDDMLKLAIDVDVKIPCPLTTVEVYDQKASHLIDIHRKLEFKRLTSAGKPLPTESQKEEHARDTGVDAVVGPSDPESERIFTFLDKNKDGILVVGEVRIEQLQDLKKKANEAIESEMTIKPGKDGELTMTEYLAAGGAPLLNEFTHGTATWNDKAIQQMVADEEWCKIEGTLIVPSISADFTISSGNDDRLLKLSYEDNPALMQGPGEEIPGINTSHAIHRLNFLQPKADSGAKPASVWGQSWWTRRLVGFGALKEPDAALPFPSKWKGFGAIKMASIAKTAQAAKNKGRWPFGFGLQKKDDDFEDRDHDIVLDPYSDEEVPTPTFMSGMHRFVPVDHSLDRVIQLMDKDRVQFHYEVGVVGFVDVEGLLSYKSTAAQSHFQLNSASKERPMLRFSYDVAPIVLSYSKKYLSLLDLIARILGIVGGVYAMASLFEGTVVSGIHSVAIRRLVLR